MITNLSVSNFTSGTMPDNRLSPNVALLNGIQSFTGVKTFVAAPIFSSAGVPFSVSSTSLVANLNADRLDGFDSAAFPRLASIQTWTGANNFSDSGNSFTGNGSGLTNIPWSSIMGAPAFLTGVSVNATLIGNGTSGGPLGLAQQGATGGQILKWTGATWAPANDLNTTYVAGTGLSLTGNTFAFSTLFGDARYSQTGHTHIAADITAGVLSDARLSPNVALLNSAQVFTGAKTFSTAPAFSAASTPFSVTSSSLVANLNADLLDGLNSSAFLQSIPVPLALSGSTGLYIVKGENSSTLSGAKGLWGFATGATGSVSAVAGQVESTSGRGVYGHATASTGTTYGGYFDSSSTSGFGVYAVSAGTYGVYGRSSLNSGASYGGYFESAASSGRGVYGHAIGTSGISYGGYFESDSPFGFGVYATSAGLVGVSGSVSQPSGSTSGGSFQSFSTSGTGVKGIASATSGTTYGGSFQAVSSSGVGGMGSATASTGTTYGLFGSSSSTSGRGVFGEATATSGTTYGGRFEADSTTGHGIFALATSATGQNYGGRFQTNSTDGRGIYALANSSTGTNFGGKFETNSPDGYGVYALADASTGTNYGVYGRSNGTEGYGVYGVTNNSNATGFNAGVLGTRIGGPNGWAISALGDFYASGMKAFCIDDPSDPANYNLLHYCSESPQPQNFYSGNVVTDALGYAWISLPDYFAEINKEFKYQLTIIDTTDDFVLAKVSREIEDNRFQVRTSKPKVKVSWRVEATRNDPYVRFYPLPDRRAKSGRAKGKYLHPELYGAPPEQGIFWQPDLREGAGHGRK